jgi:hypothetical protein
MTDKQIQTYLKQNYPQSVLDDTVKFLEENKASLFNLALLGAGEFRVMYRLPDNKVEARIFNIRQ